MAKKDKRLPPVHNGEHSYRVSSLGTHGKARITSIARGDGMSGVMVQSTTNGLSRFVGVAPTGAIFEDTLDDETSFHRFLVDAVLYFAEIVENHQPLAARQNGFEHYETLAMATVRHPDGVLPKGYFERFCRLDKVGSGDRDYEVGMTDRDFVWRVVCRKVPLETAWRKFHECRDETWGWKE